MAAAGTLTADWLSQDDVRVKLRGDECEQPHAFAGHRPGVGAGEWDEGLDVQRGFSVRARGAPCSLEQAVDQERASRAAAAGRQRDAAVTGDDPAALGV